MARGALPCAPSPLLQEQPRRQDKDHHTSESLTIPFGLLLFLEFCIFRLRVSCSLRPLFPSFVVPAFPSP
jgi:hypothetical protein